MNKEFSWFYRGSVFFLSILILLFFLRLVLPQYIKYLFFPFLTVVAILSSIELFYKQNIRNIKLFYQIDLFKPLITISILYLSAFVLTQDKQSILIREFVNVFSVFTIGFIIWAFIIKGGNLKIVIAKISKLVLIFSSIFAGLGLLKLYFQLMGIKFKFLIPDGFGYPKGSCLAIDDNFFTLICIFGIIFAIPLLLRKAQFLKQITLQLSLIVLLLNIFLSTSRRGFIIASLLIVGTLFVWLLSFIIKRDNLTLFRKNTLMFGGVSFLLISVVLCLLFFVTPMERNKRLSYSKFNKNEVYLFANQLALSAKSILKGETVNQEVNKEIWQTNLNSLYPYSGWAAGNYIVLSDLPSDSKTILPEGAVGAKIDKTVESFTYDKNAYYKSKLFEGKIEKGKRYIAKIFCYVSPNFNGDWVRLSSQGKIKGLNSTYYNMRLKGKWQELQTSFYGDSGCFSNYLYISKLNSNTFDSLKGYVVYAYPVVKETVFNSKQPITWANTQFEEIGFLPGTNADIIPDSTLAFKFSENSFIKKDSLIYAISNVYSINVNDKKSRDIISIYAYVSENFNGDKVYLGATGRYRGLGISRYNLDEKGKWEKLFLSVSPENSNVNINFGLKKVKKNNIDSLKGYVLFAYPTHGTMKFDPKNPLTWAERKFKEIKKISGEKSEIVPINSIGYLIDKDGDFDQSKYTNNYVTYSRIGKSTILNGKRYISSVYCYVSKDFNGENVKLEVWGKFYGFKSDYYDLEKRGEWQKLILNNYGDSSYIVPSIYCEVPDNKSFKWLKGYVIFAYPELNIIDYSPSKPSSYFGTTFTKEFPLIGNNSSIVPQNVVGYRLDKSSKGKIWKNICYSTTEFLSIPVVIGDSIYASVYCYVSEDFNGNDVRLETRGIKNTIVRYDLIKNKGKWVKLETNSLMNNNGRVSGVLFFSQKDVSDFNTLKGHVTFAYPIIKVIKRHSDKLSLITRIDNKSRFVFEKASIISSLNFIANILQPNKDSLNFEPDFQKEMVNDHFSGPRLDRWRYALFLYKNEYKWWQKIIGGGFGHTRKFAKTFNTDYDYPHNPFLSVLLYSGFLGLFAYFWVLYKAIFYYLKYRKEYWTFFLCFLVTFFFSFFSGNSPFDPAIMGLFTVLPFFIHYIHQKDNLENEKISSIKE